jgi:hypothetical protein
MSQPKAFTMNRTFGGEPDRDYTKALTTCDTLDDLRALVTAYEPIAIDAPSVVATMTAEDFAEWRRGLKIERRGKFAGEAFAKKFGAILMPMPMMRISMIADEYKAPFGVTWMRLKELRPDLLQAGGRPASSAGETK